MCLYMRVLRARVHVRARVCVHACVHTKAQPQPDGRGERWHTQRG